MGPTWVLSAPDGPHAGPMHLAIRVGFSKCSFYFPDILCTEHQYGTHRSVWWMGSKWFHSLCWRDIIVCHYEVMISFLKWKRIKRIGSKCHTQCIFVLSLLLLLICCLFALHLSHVYVKPRCMFHMRFCMSQARMILSAIIAIFLSLHRTRPVFNLYLCKVLANERRHTCIVFYNWLKTCSVTG